MRQINDPAMVAREYSTTERLAGRRLDRTAWLRGEDEPWFFALRAIAEVQPRRVLDAGCGNGDFAALITAPEVVCVDKSEAAVEAVRRRELIVHRADITSLPFGDGEFDVVSCNWVLYHLQDPEAGVAELARVLRPGGRFVGIYNQEDHLAEFWQQVTTPVWNEEPFGCETGSELLRRYFDHVESYDAVTEAMWETRDAAQAFLDAFSEMIGPLRAPNVSYPLKATRRNCVLVADKTPTVVFRPPDPPLTDGVIRLRPFDERDLDALERTRGDPEIERWFGPSKLTAREILDKKQREWLSGHAAAFAICEANDVCLGQVFVFLEDNDVGSLGYWLLPEGRGRGLATRATRLAAGWALMSMGVARLQLWVEPGNAASQRVAERTGFVHEGTLRSYKARNGQRLDAVYYSLLPADLHQHSDGPEDETPLKGE